MSIVASSMAIVEAHGELRGGRGDAATNTRDASPHIDLKFVAVKPPITCISSTTVAPDSEGTICQILSRQKSVVAKSAMSGEGHALVLADVLYSCLRPRGAHRDV